MAFNASSAGEEFGDGKAADEGNQQTGDRPVLNMLTDSLCGTLSLFRHPAIDFGGTPANLFGCVLSDPTSLSYGQILHFFDERRNITFQCRNVTCDIFRSR